MFKKKKGRKKRRRHFRVISSAAAFAVKSIFHIADRRYVFLLKYYQFILFLSPRAEKREEISLQDTFKYWQRFNTNKLRRLNPFGRRSGFYVSHYYRINFVRTISLLLPFGVPRAN